MTDEYKLSRAIGKQAQAQALLDNEAFQEAFDGVYKLLVDGIMAEADEAVRNKMWDAAVGVKNAEILVKKWVANGRLAQKEIDNITGKRNAA